MASLKVMAAILIVSFTLVGCQENEKLVEENKNLNIHNTELENQLQNKIIELEKISTNLNHVEEENQRIAQQLNELRNQKNNVPIFNVFKENLFVASEVLSYETLTVTKIKDLLGEPNKITEGAAVHGPGSDLVLKYDEATFFFRGDKEEQAIRSLIISKSFFTTSDGITIGSTKREVKKVYGEYIQEDNDNFISLGGKTGMSFKFIDDRVSEIFIWFQYE